MTARDRLRRFVARFPNQQAAAQRLGVSAALLSMWLSGARRPGLASAFKLQDVAKIPAKSWATSTLHP